MNEFKIGDIVILKSGSPEMTIEELRNQDYVTCIWFCNADNKMKQHIANRQTIVKV